MDTYKRFWRIGKILIAALLLLLCMVQAFAQNIKTYKVKRNETTQSVAKKFDLTEDELLDCNKSFKGVALKKGDILLIPIYNKNNPKPVPAPKAPVDGKITDFVSHTVQPKETLYGISRKYTITQDVLSQYNPQLKERGLQIGMVLQIPVLSSSQKEASQEKINKVEAASTSLLVTEHTVLPKETMYGISHSYGITQEELCSYNPFLRTSSLQIGMVLKIPSKTEGEPIEQDTSKVALTPISKEGKYSHLRPLIVDVMLPFYVNKVDSLVFLPEKERLKESKTAISFYMGVRMALDSLGRDGLKADVRVFDSQRNISAVDDILSKNNFNNTDVVIGPLFAEIAEYVCTKLNNSKTLVVSPFSVRHNVGMIPNIVQASSSADSMQENLLDYIITSVKSNTKMVILAPVDKMTSQIESIKNRLASKVGSDNITVLDSEKEETVVLLADKMRSEACSIVTPMLNVATMNVINAAISTTEGSNSPITVYAADTDARAKKMMSENSGIASSRTSYIYASRFFEKKQHSGYNDFISGYIRRYHEQPNTYAIEAFDVTYDMLLRLASSSENEVERALTDVESVYIGGSYRYAKHEAGGYENTNVYILHYRKAEGEKLLN